MEKIKANIKKEAKSRAQAAAEQVIQPPAKNDPLGSYTGHPIDGGKPTQDADDL